MKLLHAFVFLTQARALEIINELKREISNTKFIVSNYLDVASLMSEKLGDLIADMQSTTAVY